MKTCSVCGLHVEDDYLYCWEDGTRLNEGPVVRAPNPSTQTIELSEHLPGSVRDSEEAQSQCLLYCPICTGAFPLTFVVCPIDQLPLTTKLFSRRASPETHIAPVEEPRQEAAGEIHLAQVEDPLVPDTETPRFNHRETIPLCDSSPENLFVSEPEEPGNTRFEFLRPLYTTWLQFCDRTRQFRHDIRSNHEAPNRRSRSTDWSSNFLRSRKRVVDNTPKGMRMAARGTAAALILLTLAAIYAIYSLAGRSPSRSSGVRPSSIAQQEPPLIATPREAREYRAESESSGSSVIDEEGPVDRVGEARLDPTPRTALIAPARSLTSVAAAGPRHAIGGGRFTTRLVRVRSNRSPTGYRYTLTFTLNEQAGRAMQWERLSVITHSANGTTHSESLPFQYVLAGFGALTFTINVDLPGTIEADWRGRISCTSVGADDSGRPLRASFGADVAP